MASRLGHFALPLPLARSSRGGDNTSMTSAKIKSTAFTTIDFDRPGKQVGFVMIPHSPHEDAWGVTRVPLAVIANGDGPDGRSSKAATTATSTRARSPSAS